MTPIIAFVIALASSVFAQGIVYNVITDQPMSMLAVVVDNTTYPLKRSEKSSILFTGSAPAAQRGYRYAKLEKANGAVQAQEPFVRQPCKDSSTVNEFYNRNWNSKSVAKFPQIKPPISSIHRIKTDLHRDGQIPTIYLEGDPESLNYMHQNTSADAKVNVRMSYISLDDVQLFEDVELSLSGRSTRWMAKLPYSIKLAKKDSLYGFRRIKLRAFFSDSSYMREKLAVDFLRSAGVPTSDTSFVRVMINDVSVGLFGVIENFKNPWLANEFAGGSDDYKHGIMYQGWGIKYQSLSDLSYKGDDAAAYANGEYIIKVKPSKGTGSFDRLRDLIRFIHTAPSTEPNAVATWQAQLDVDSFIRALAFEILLGLSDGFLAMSDNYNLYDDIQSNRFVYIPNDFDLTLGSTVMDLKKMRSGNYKDYPGFELRPLVAKVLSVPEFKQQFEDTLRDITSNLVNPSITDKRIDDLFNLISDDVEWDMKDCPRLGKDQFYVGSLKGFKLTPTTDRAANEDYLYRLMKPEPFRKSVYGPQSRPSLVSIKEWIKSQHEAISHVMAI